MLVGSGQPSGEREVGFSRALRRWPGDEAGPGGVRGLRWEPGQAVLGAALGSGHSLHRQGPQAREPRPAHRVKRGQCTVVIMARSTARAERHRCTPPWRHWLLQAGIGSASPTPSSACGQSREQCPITAGPGPRAVSRPSLHCRRGATPRPGSGPLVPATPGLPAASSVLSPRDCASRLCLVTALPAESRKKMGPGERGGDATLVPRAAGPINPCGPGWCWPRGGPAPAILGPSPTCPSLIRPQTQIFQGAGSSGTCEGLQLPASGCQGRGDHYTKGKLRPERKDLAAAVCGLPGPGRFWKPAMGPRRARRNPAAIRPGSGPAMRPGWQLGGA